jgi:hypothetical protein
LVAGAEAAAPASSLLEEACAAAGAQSAAGFAAAERVGSGSARADWVQDERFRDGYSELAVSAVPQEGDSSPVD